jgi:YHS domain-containing protein
LSCRGLSEVAFKAIIVAKKKMKKLLMAGAFMLLVLQVSAQTEIFSKSNEAINGYDPVAYFTESKPVKGKNEFTFVWKESNWFFSSAKNRDLFKADPEKYAPQFGGFCAYGVSEDHKSPTSPDAWTIVDGKLYLNYNKDVKELWTKDRDSRIKVANENWLELKKEKD